MRRPFKYGACRGKVPSLIPKTRRLSPCSMADTRNKMVSICERALMPDWGGAERGLADKSMAYGNELLQEVQMTVHVS